MEFRTDVDLLLLLFADLLVNLGCDLLGRQVLRSHDAVDGLSFAKCTVDYVICRS